MTTPERDTCRIVNVDGEPVRVRGSRPMTEQEQGYLADIVRAVHARQDAKDGEGHTTTHEDTNEPAQHEQ